MPAIPFKCPLCSHPLKVPMNQIKNLRCDNNHNFDVSKEGYVNLLPVQQKNSRAPGDNELMIRARQRFLDAGYYQGLVDSITRLFETEHSGTLLDIGCGEGYYTQQLARSVPADIHGIDIAKGAVKKACKRLKTGTFSVANAFSLPYFDNSFDIALCIFSPMSITEAVRVLTPRGRLYYVEPGANHLRELAGHIYDVVKPHDGSSKDLASNPMLAKVETQTIREEIIVSGEHILDLLTMTPYYWRASAEVTEKLSNFTSLSVSLDFKIHICQINDIEL